MQNENALLMIEHAITYLEGREYHDSFQLAIDTLYEAHKAVGPMGQLSSWEATWVLQQPQPDPVELSPWERTPNE